MSRKQPPKPPAEAKKRPKAKAVRKRLTDKIAGNLDPQRRPYRVWDKGGDALRGLHVLVQPTGTRTYRVLYRFPNSSRQHFLVLGRVGEVSLDDARTRALEVRRMAAKGIDPAKAAGETVDDDASFKATVERWIAREQIGRKMRVSADETRKYVLTTCARWHSRPLASLRYAEIDDLLCELRDGDKRRGRKPAPYSANRVYAHLKTMFKWAVLTKRIEANPMADMPKPWLGEQGRKREWFKGDAADDAICRIWHAAGEMGGAREKFLKLLLLLGKRIAAIETMRWEHIDARWHWRPPIGSKNKRCHAITLPKLARSLLEPRGIRGRVLDPIRPQSIAADVRKLTGMSDYIHHGIRHIIATKLKRLKVSPYVARELLDHVAFNDEHAGYEHEDYEAEVTAALELWCARIEHLVTPAAKGRQTA